MLCENTVAIEDGAKVLQGPTCERSHHHRRVAPTQHWVAEAHFMSGCRGASRAFGRRFNSWAEQRRMHDQTTHGESVHTDASWDWRCNAPKHPVQSHVKNLNFLNFLENHLFLTIFFEKHPFPQIFLQKKKSSFVQNSFCGNLFPFWKMSFSSFSESCFMISLLCFFVENVYSWISPF